MSAASVLDTISVKSPCTVPWDSMRGTDRARFCSHCRQSVFNLSEMTRAEAEELILLRNGRLCARYYQRADGTIATRPCNNWRRKLAWTVGAFFAALVAMFGWLISTSNEDRYHNGLRRTEPFATVFNWIDPAPPTHFVMGEIMLPP